MFRVRGFWSLGFRGVRAQEAAGVKERGRAHTRTQNLKPSSSERIAPCINV